MPGYFALSLRHLAHHAVQVIVHGGNVGQSQGLACGRGSKPYSDLDRAVWPANANDPGLDLALAEFRADLQDSALPWRVDVSLAQDLPVALRQMVLQHGVGLQRAVESAY